MSDEAAFLQAIIAQPGEDTPRLAYADWLDEHDAPIQAEFIRLQCRLASCSAADPEYPDLLERYAEVAVQFQPIVKHTVPALPPGFAFDTDLERSTDNFRRGFLHTVQSEDGAAYQGVPNTQIDQLCAGLPELIATTTARQLSLRGASAEQLIRILAAPGAEAITGLILHPMWWGQESHRGALQAVVAAKCASRLERLDLVSILSSTESRLLANANFACLSVFDLTSLRFHDAATDLHTIMKARWFQGLRVVRASYVFKPLEPQVVAVLAQLPRLESLKIRITHRKAFAALYSSGGFQSLASLDLGGSTFTKTALHKFAKAKFPRLTEFIAYFASRELPILLTAPWLAQLRVLELASTDLTNENVAALAANPVAANLRILRLRDSTFGNTALAALASGESFPNLTTLDIGTDRRPKSRTQGVTKFATNLTLPRIRHLNLSGWPLGDAGAKALAANPAFANLTRLSLAGCEIGEKGLTAIVRSPHLQQLIELDVARNKLKTAAALRDTTYLPRLAAARLDGNPISIAAHRKLHAVRGLLV